MPSRAFDTAGHGPSFEFGWPPTYPLCACPVMAPEFFHCTVTLACAALVPILYKQVSIRRSLRGWLHSAAVSAVCSR